MDFAAYEQAGYTVQVKRQLMSFLLRNLQPQAANSAVKNLLRTTEGGEES